MLQLSERTRFPHERHADALAAELVGRVGLVVVAMTTLTWRAGPDVVSGASPVGRPKSRPRTVASEIPLPPPRRRSTTNASKGCVDRPAPIVP